MVIGNTALFYRIFVSDLKINFSLGSWHQLLNDLCVSRVLRL